MVAVDLPLLNDHVEPLLFIIFKRLICLSFVCIFQIIQSLNEEKKLTEGVWLNKIEIIYKKSKKPKIIRFYSIKIARKIWLE